jgi:hypothetical protein
LPGLPAREEEITHPGSLHNAEVLSSSSASGRNDWHVRFAPSAINGVRRVVFRSAGTKEIAAAKRIGARIIESFWTDAGRGAEALKLRDDNATIDELIERY